MLKTITVNKRMRLDELIKYAWENDIKNTIYESDNGQIVKFLGNGRYESGWNFGSDDLFTVRVEEEITENTMFERCVVLLANGAIQTTPISCNIKFIKEFYKEPIKVYVMTNKNLELIWERED